MKYTSIALLCLLCVGCKGVNKLMNKDAQDAPERVYFIDRGGEMPKTAPDMGLTVPVGYKRIIYYGELPTSGVVPLSASSSFVDVFMLDRDINQWFKLGDAYSDGAYYHIDGQTITISSPIKLKGYLVYQYIKVSGW